MVFPLVSAVSQAHQCTPSVRFNFTPNLGRRYRTDVGYEYAPYS